MAVKDGGQRQLAGRRGKGVRVPSALQKVFFCKTAVIAVRSGESTEQAWRRHVAEHPEDATADIKIFNCGPPSP